MEGPQKIADFLKLECVAGELAARDKVGALTELVALTVKSGAVKDGERALEVILEREKLGSTGMNEGAAIPHGRLPEITSIVAALGRSKEGIPYESLDGEPVDVIFMLLTPEGGAGLHLKALARIARLLKNRNFREGLRQARDAGEIHALIDEYDAGG